MLEAELAQGTPLNAAIQGLLAKLFAEHMPIVFDGNGYSDEWLAEAEKRGLPNLKDTVAALAHYSDKDVMAVFERHGVLSPRENVVPAGNFCWRTTRTAYQSKGILH